MEHIVINGVSINTKHFNYTHEELLNDFRLRNLLEDVVAQIKNKYEIKKI